MNKKILLFISLILVVLSLFACNNKENEQLLADLPEMVREGRELLSYVYGDGLPYDKDGDEPYRKGYVAVNEDSEIKSIADFEEKIDELFTESSTIVFARTAFVRTISDEVSHLPRYIEDENGILYINKEHEGNILKREPDYESFKIVDSNKFMAEVEVTMIYEDESEETDTFILRKEDNKWKFDSAAIL